MFDVYPVMSNITGLDDILKYVSTISNGMFMLYFLMAVGFTIGILMYYGSKRAEGRGDIIAAATVAITSITVIEIILSLSKGIISTLVIVPTIVLNIIFLVILFTRER